ncbi:MAG: META domain-containing protein [Gammaproteobacteria bacterium]|nr:META domain-containing protein [Gammaproteobacteria bacterium]
MNPHFARASPRYALALAITLAGCANTTLPIDNTAWQLARWEGHDLGGDTPPPDLHIEQRQVWGYTGCNQFSAGYTVDNGKLIAHDLRITRAACANPAKQQLEQALITALKRGVPLARQAQQLRLETESAPLEFVRHEPPLTQSVRP